MRTLAALCLCLLLALAHGAGAQSEPADTVRMPDTLQLDLVPCFLEDCAGLAADSSLQFFQLTVPARWDRPESGSYRLSGVVLKALAEAPPSDPVIFLPGGPGGSLVQYTEDLRGFHLRGIRDVVLLDLRGTGFSGPTLCPDLNDGLWDAFSEDLDPSGLRGRVAEEMRACAEDLEDKGIDPAHFASAQTTHDLEALRRALGADAWNLYGVSFGTWIAQVYQRTYPERVRSMVLDSPLPIDYPWLDDHTANYHRALDLLFSTCTQDPDCLERFPNLETSFYQAAELLRTRPLAVEVARELPGDSPFVINYAEWHGLVFQLLYHPHGYAILPWLVEALIDRDQTLFRQLISNQYGEFENLDRGNYLAVMANDAARQLSDFSEETLFDPDYPRLREAMALTIAMDLGVRSAIEVQPDSLAPVYGPDPSVPVLIASGRFDPITPPNYGQRMTSLYPNSIYLNFPGQAHGALHRGNPCGQQIARHFITTPGDRSSLGCVAEQEKGIPYVTRLYRNPTLSFLAERLRAGAWATYGWLGLSLALLLSGPMWWLFTHLARKLRSAEPHPAGASMARASMVATAVVVVVLLALLGHYLARTADGNPYVLLFGLVPQARWLPVLSWMVGLGALGGVAGAVSAWLFGWWKKGARTHFSLVVLGAVMMAIFLLRYQLF